MEVKRANVGSENVLVVSTGKQELDRKLGGGIPRGSLCLVEGQSDAGKSVLVQQFTYGSLMEGLAVNYYSTENTIRSLLIQMESLGLPVLDYLLLGMMRIYPIQMIPNIKETALMFEALLDHYKAQKAEIIVIDSLTNLAMYSQPEDLLGFFHACKALCDSGKTMFLTVHSQALGKEMLTRLCSLCDVHLHLRIEEVGSSLRKILEVSKVRGALKTTGNLVSFDVEPNLGMRVFPIAQARA